MNRIRSGQSVKSRLVLPLLALPLFAAASGCAPGGGMSLIVTTPNTNQVLDAGQSLPITATVINDAQAFGATFAATSGTFSPETITRVAATSIVGTTYTAPASVTTQTTVTVTATSQNTPSQTASFTITLYPALAISTATLPNGTVGTAYSSTVATTGGSGSLAFSIASGALPTGLSLNTTGAITGTPSAFGTFTFTVSVQDASVAKIPTTQSYTVTIAPQQPVITTTTLPNGLAGSSYSQQLTYTGGNGTTPTFTATGALPAGLTLSSSGLISGTPTVASSGATYGFSVTVTVGTQTSAPAQLSITVPAYPTVTTTTLPPGNVGIGYSKQLNYNGGVGTSVTWAISPANALAGSGLTLSPSGLLSGTPMTATSYSFNVTVTVGSRTSAPQALTLIINALDITSSPTATGEVGLPFSFQLTAAGGTPPYTWKLAAGSTALPLGLSLNAATGVISGTPTANGTTAGVIVQATDSATAPPGTATLSMTFTIAPVRSSANNSELTGSYAFLVSGFDTTGHPLAAAGTFTANGTGVITGGSIDINGTGLAAPLGNQALTASSYSVGADNRGKLTLTYGGTTLTFVTVANGISSNVATAGYLTEFDNSGQSLTGVMALQTSAPYTVTSINNGFAFGMNGFAANSTASALVHRSAAGEIQFNGIGGFTTAEYLESSATASTPTAPTAVAITVASTGRGTLAITPPAGSVQHFVIYAVSPTKFYLLSSDNASGTTSANDLLFGQALQQTGAGAFTNASLSGSAIVRTQSLPIATTGTYVDARLGIYTFTSNSAAIALSGDENAGGAAKTLTQTGTYSVAGNGRVTVNFPSGLSGCVNCVGSGNTFFYLVSPNQGFVMDFTAAAVAGSFEPQAATALSASSFSGNYAIGTTLPLTQGATYLTAEAVASGTGTVSGTADQNTNGTLSPDVSLSGTYVVAPSGRATFTALGSGSSVLYIVSSSKAYLLDTATMTPVIEDVIK